MKATLIISVYKDVESLRAIFKSIELQTEKEIEIIVSQDDNSNCFFDLVNDYKRQKYQITLLQQEDNGFRKNKILNESIRIAKTEKLIFIDGDCVLHPDFIRQHITNLKSNSFCCGRRVDLDAITSKKIRTGEIVVPSKLEMFKNHSNRIEESFDFLSYIKKKSKIHLLGCNMSFNKSDLIKINGFDEDYVNPGYGEDVDIEYRAMLYGLEKVSVRYKAIQYHLFHERPDREDEAAISRETFLLKKTKREYYCKNGLNILN